MPKNISQLYSFCIFTQCNFNLQTNGVTVKTENTNDKHADKPSDGNNVGNITIKQEPVDPTNSENMSNGNIQGHIEVKTEIKQENMKPPPEKKPRVQQY